MKTMTAMMSDIWALLWLRWRQFQDAAIYWLRVLGYQSKDASFSGKMYIVYLLAIGAFWVVAMWAWGADQANTLGKLLTPGGLIQFLNIIPYLVLVTQIYVMIVALQSSPLKLSFADMAYVAGSPISPAAPVILGYIRQVALRLLMFAALWALLAVFLIRPLGSNLGSAASSRALIAIIPLTLLTWGLAWLIGVTRLVSEQLIRWRYVWLLPLLLFGLAYAAPDFILWPGRALIIIIFGEQPMWLIPVLVVFTIIPIAAFIWLSQRINMVRVCDESILFARIQALGILAWRQPNVQLRIRLQTARATRKPLLHLPKAQGFWMLLARAGLSYIRHPFMLLTSLAWGAAMTEAAVLIIAGKAPAQLWIGWLLLAGFVPPIGLLHVFQNDLEEKFLRQFLPVNGFELFIADMIVPLVFLILGGVSILFLQRLPSEIIAFGVVAISLLAVMLALCGAVSLTNRRVLQTRIIATAVSFGAVMVAFVNFGGATIALGVAVFAVMILSGMVASEA